jgi:hypothetical protein
MSKLTTVYIQGMPVRIQFTLHMITYYVHTTASRHIFKQDSNKCTSNACQLWHSVGGINDSTSNYNILLPCILVCIFLGAFAKLRKATISFLISVRPSVRPHCTTQLPLDIFPSLLISGYFSGIWRENWSSIKIRQEKRVFCMRTYANLW